MILPTKKTPAKRDITSANFLFLGGAKFGKSTLLSQFPKMCIFATEPGCNFLDVFQVIINTWEELNEALAEIAKGKHGFSSFGIDTVGNAYQMCTEYICREWGIKHESDLGYGKGYALVNNEFHRLITRFAALDQGLFLVSHSQTKEVDTQQGKINRVVPTLPTKARKMVLGLMDFILYCDFEMDKDEDGQPIYKRVLRTKPNLYYEAGDRTGRLPKTIDFDYQTLVTAFNDAISIPQQRKPDASTSKAHE